MPECRDDALNLLAWPRGPEMHARLERHAASRRSELPMEDARDVLRNGLAAIRAIGMEVANLDRPIRIIEETASPATTAFAQADTPFMSLFDELVTMALRETGPAGERAFHELSEPLYQSALSYDVTNWIRWPLCAPLDAADLTEPAYRLWMGGWSGGWDEEGLFLFRWAR